MQVAEKYWKEWQKKRQDFEKDLANNLEKHSKGAFAKLKEQEPSPSIPRAPKRPRDQRKPLSLKATQPSPKVAKVEPSAKPTPEAPASSKREHLQTPLIEALISRTSATTQQTQAVPLEPIRSTDSRTVWALCIICDPLAQALLLKYLLQRLELVLSRSITPFKDVTLLATLQLFELAQRVATDTGIDIHFHVRSPRRIHVHAQVLQISL
jgi:hypothetical protein